jgi:hypothetical protein
MRKLILALLILIIAATAAAADTIYMRDGRTVRGTVIGFISNRFAVRLSQATNITPQRQAEVGEIVYLRSRDIERVEIEGRDFNEARFLTKRVEVELGPNWVDSGVDVRRGQRIEIRADGVIMVGRSRLTPGGLRSTDPNAPLPRAAEGVLIAAIGDDPNSPITEIGLSREFVADSDGRIYLTANRSSYTDARGAFNATIRSEINFRSPRSTSSNRTEADDDYDPFGSDSTTSARVRRRSRTSIGGTQTDTYPSRTPQEKTISVPGNSQGTDTGIDLRTGDQVTITATGNITAGRRAGVVSADGGRAGAGQILGTYPVPQAGVGALIGYIRMPNGQITQAYLIGSQITFSAPADGRLILLINDDNYGDNSGAFDVRITY